jgi:hypothetical protein
MKSEKLLLTILFFLVVSITYSQTVVYVTENGGGNQSGDSWANAIDKLQLQSKIQNANNNTHFWLKQGTYNPTYSANRNITFSIRSNIRIYGGFSGNETNLAERDTSSFSVFNGDLLNNDSNTSYKFNEISRSDNTYHLFTIETDFVATSLYC